MNKKSLFKRLFATLTSLTVLATCTITTAFLASADEEANPSPIPYNMEVISDTQRIYSGENYEVDYSITSSWDDNQMISVTVTNTGTEPIGNWSLLYDFGGEVENIYNAEVKENEYFSYVTHSSDNFGEITPNSSTNFGYTLVGAESNYFPDSVDMVQSRQTISEGLTIELANIYDAYDTFGGQLILTNTTDNQICMPEITINANFSLLSNWGYDIIDLGENSYTIKSKFDTGIFINIPPNSSYTLQISGSNVENPQIESFSATELVVSVEEYVSRDSDGDTLPDYYENAICSDKYDTDSDDDMLPDDYEVLFIGTLPGLGDTDNNGVSDADEDADEDFLTNLQEFELGTDPIEPDTDEDYLIDGEEVAAGSDPFVQDTDIDELLDGEEGYASITYTKYGIYFDPTNPDTDGNGVLDGDEKFAQNVQKEVESSDGAITNISVEMTANGSLDNNLRVESVMGIDIMSSNLVGLVGDPFDFSTTSEFEEAKLTFTIDTTKLGENSFEDLIVVWYDEENQKYEMMPCELNLGDSTITATTTHFSVYGVINIKTWTEVWKQSIGMIQDSGKEKEPGVVGPETIYIYNTVFAIDVSGSMLGIDSINNPQSPFPTQRAVAVKSFIDAMLSNDEEGGNNKENNKVGIVSFSDSATKKAELTNDIAKLENALRSLSDGGGTNFNDAFDKSLSLFDELVTPSNSGSTSYKNVNNIMLISDGGSLYSDSYLNQAKQKGIKITTIGVGSGADYVKLQRIAEYTGGSYFQIAEIDELNSFLVGENWYKINVTIDTTDADIDGIFDIIETEGLMANGQKIDSDPTTKHSDNDGLEDAEEILWSSELIPQDEVDLDSFELFVVNAIKNKQPVSNTDFISNYTTTVNTDVSVDVQTTSEVSGTNTVSDTSGSTAVVGNTSTTTSTTTTGAIVNGTTTTNTSPETSLPETTVVTETQNEKIIVEPVKTAWDNLYTWNVKIKSDPAAEDGDGDWLFDPEEINYSNALSPDTDGDKINDFTDPTPKSRQKIKNSNWETDWSNVDVEDYMSRRDINELIIMGVQEVALGNYHSCIMLFANSESEYYNSEYALNSVGNIHYLTLGAGPAVQPAFDPLTADYNRPKDIKLTNKVQMINLTTSAEINSFIPKLLECQAYFIANSNPDYILIPKEENEHNSNSYAAGLLNCSGIDDLGGPDYNVPGYKYPVPNHLFGK